jgi:hypothetical protein
VPGVTCSGQSIMQPEASIGRSAIAALAWRCGVVLGALVAVAGAAAASPAAPGSGFIYTCTTGKLVVKTDHLMVDCKGRQKRVSPAGVEEWILTPEQEDLSRRCRDKRDAAVIDWRNKDRSDKNLLIKYPEAAALSTARDEALAPARASVVRIQGRLQDLGKERLRLGNEREFYPTGPLPAKLQRDIDNNDALIKAQEQALRQAQEDVTRISANFDELGRTMKKLWSSPSASTPVVDCSPEALFGR